MDNKHRFLVMQAGSMQYAVPFEQVAEVTDVRLLSPVPRAPAWCLGTTRSAGVVLAVIDLACYMGEDQERAPVNLVVVDREAGGLGLHVGVVTSLILGGEAQRVEDAYGSWITAPGIKAELVDLYELVQEVGAALSR